MGACNGYAYHDLRPDRKAHTSAQPSAFLSRIDRPVLVPDYEGREADEKMLAAILAVPEEPENRHPHGVY